MQLARSEIKVFDEICSSYSKKGARNASATRSQDTSARWNRPQYPPTHTCRGRHDVVAAALFHAHSPRHRLALTFFHTIHIRYTKTDDYGNWLIHTENVLTRHVAEITLFVEQHDAFLFRINDCFHSKNRSIVWTLRSRRCIKRTI